MERLKETFRTRRPIPIQVHRSILPQATTIITYLHRCRAIQAPRRNQRPGGQNKTIPQNNPLTWGADGVVVISACSIVTCSIQKFLFSYSRVRVPHPPESNNLDTFWVLPPPMSESRENTASLSKSDHVMRITPSKIT